MLQELGSDWRKNSDGVLCVTVHSEDIAEVAGTEVAKEDTLREHCDTGEQGAVFRARCGLEADQEVRRARDASAEQQERRGLHTRGLGVRRAVYERGMLGPGPRPVSQLRQL